MNSINQLFDNFAVAYQHSLYAVEQEKVKAVQKRDADLASIKKHFDRERSKNATITSNAFLTTLHNLDEIADLLSIDDDTILKTAEYLRYGTIRINNLEKMIFSDTSIPCILPFIGHGSVILESGGDECQKLGVQFAMQALLQTAPGQLMVTIINPELRSEFSSFTNLPNFEMLTKESEIKDFLLKLEEELIETNSLVQVPYESLVELRRGTQQPIGKLRLIVLQDLSSENGEAINQIVRLLRIAPRAGMSFLILGSKSTVLNDSFFRQRISIPNCSIFKFFGNQWVLQKAGKEKFVCEFPVKTSSDISSELKKLTEQAKNTSVISIPIDEIENMEKMWSESSVEHIVFNLGKSGLNTVSVCIGDKISQCHNILISGAAGQGKSNLLEVMVHSLCWRYSPKEVELYLLDYKDGLTFKRYSDKTEKTWLPHARMLGIESDRDVGLAILKDLEKERNRRAKVFRDAPKNGAKDYEEYRNKFPSNVMPRILLVVDEYQKLFEINDDIAEEASSLLENLVRQGRACAIHVVLASQSINGLAGLLGKDERIYAQFPVRIALKNNPSESYALFGIGNDAAAQLQVRGEAVINENYGAIKSNKKFTVAYANPEVTKRMRQSFCLEYGDLYPTIFTRQDYMDFSMIMAEVKKWRSEIQRSGVIRVPIGIKLSINKNIISVPFMNDVGRNIAILGSAEDLRKEGAIPGQTNIAIGMVQSLAISLALQHPNGDARIILLDGLRQDVFKNSNMHIWLKLMERFGFPVECIDAASSSKWLMDFYQEIKDSELEEDVYVFCLGMERYSNFTEMNLCGESGTDSFQKLLKFGTKGLHFICWWSNVSTYKNHLGFGNDGYFETKVLLRMDRDTSRDVLGPFVNWSVRDNRAYIHDNSELQTDEVVIPLMPINNRISGIIESEEW